MDEADSRYVLLETYRRDGTAVRTPVWFVSRDSKIYVVTRDGTGKVKRLRSNPGVRIAPCGIAGAIKGGWTAGTAEILPPDRTSEVVGWRNKRYGIAARVAGLLSRGRGEMVALAITPG